MELPIAVVIHREDEGGYWAEVPAMPGCFTRGDNLDELFRNVREAAKGWMLAKQQIAARDLALTGERAEVVTL